jgi:hypothetical protein
MDAGWGDGGRGCGRRHVGDSACGLWLHSWGVGPQFAAIRILNLAMQMRKAGASGRSGKKIHLRSTRSRSV